MAVLIIESDRELRLMIAAAIKKLLRRKNPSIINARDLSEAEGFLLANASTLSLVVCAETLEDVEGETLKDYEPETSGEAEDKKIGNGIRMIERLHGEYLKCSIIIMHEQIKVPEDTPFDWILRDLERRTATVRELQELFIRKRSW